jgi:hypothetical protein
VVIEGTENSENNKKRDNSRRETEWEVIGEG